MGIARPDIYGWFDHPKQTTPAHDPGPQGLCPVCCHPTGRHGIDNPLKTISLAVEDPKRRNRSYFFRAHKNCWGMATQHEKALIESAVIDRAHDAAAEMTAHIVAMEDADKALEEPNSDY